MYTPSRHFADFNVSGVRFWDAAYAISSLVPGNELTLILEADNPHDSDAVALYYKTCKLGYIPRNYNYFPAQLLRFGHNNVLECRILKVDPTVETWEQIHVGLYITDKTQG